MTDGAGAAARDRRRTKKNRSGERLLDQAGGPLVRPVVLRQSSSSDRSRTAPLSADITSFA